MRIIRMPTGKTVISSAFSGLMLLSCAADAIAAEAYPARVVRLVCPISAGSGTDTVARVVAQGLTERLGKQFIVDNKPGASGIIGNDAVAKEKPDGYTLLMGTSSFVILPSLRAKLPYDTQKDLVAISQSVTIPSVLVVHPSVPARTVKELIAVGKARPEQLLFASPGQGSFPHLAMELFANMAGIRLVHVPFKSAAGIIDVTAGSVSMMMSNILQALPPVRAGRLRALGVSLTKRVAIAPDIPTIAEAGLPGYESVQWYGLLAPGGTPSDIITKLYKESAAVLQAPAATKLLADEGVLIVGSSPEEFMRYIKAEGAKWAKVIKAAGIKPE